jgi:hypothetical protein
MPWFVVPLIFGATSLLATLICYGGLLFALLELRSSRLWFYPKLESIAYPVHWLLMKRWKELRGLVGVWRSCLLCLKGFPIGCLFLVFLLPSTYLSFFASSGVPITRLARLFPHLCLEVLAYVLAASTAIGVARKLEHAVLDQAEETFLNQSRQLMRERWVWRRLAICYLGLLFSAFLERSLL